jgi:hypothetical protein
MLYFRLTIMPVSIASPAISTIIATGATMLLHPGSLLKAIEPAYKLEYTSNVGVN